MYIKKLIVENFRNIKYAELEFGRFVNIFYGNNAQGKTNLLEAIAIALGKSFRHIRKSEIIPFNGSLPVKINLFYESENGLNNEIAYQADGESVYVKINSIPLKKATDLYGEFRYVVFIPDNLNLIKGYPDSRRNYLDNIAVMQNKVHKKIMGEYKDALRQRCAAYMTKHYYGENLDVWDDILVKQGINLTYGRLKYLELIKQYAVEIYWKLTEKSHGEKLEISYESNVFGRITDKTADFHNLSKQELYGIYKESLTRINSEGQSGKTPGAHKDDVIFTVNGNNSRNYASQGQLRSIAVSLKLAESRIIREFNRENPVVLLDEVLGELDESRRQYIIQNFVNSQCFITSCNINDFKKLDGVKIWEVKEGVFISLSGE
jgi:DNA replication and repair protein RecF